MLLILDDSPGEEIALLMLILAATTAASAPQQSAEPACRVGVILVSKMVVPEDAMRQPLLVPKAKPNSKGPAVLTPACKPERGKKKDFPMA